MLSQLSNALDISQYKYRMHPEKPVDDETAETEGASAARWLTGDIVEEDDYYFDDDRTTSARVPSFLQQSDKMSALECEDPGGAKGVCMEEAECEDTPTASRNGAKGCEKAPASVMCCSKTKCKDGKKPKPKDGICKATSWCGEHGGISTPDKVVKKKAPDNTAEGCKHLPGPVQCCVGATAIMVAGSGDPKAKSDDQALPAVTEKPPDKTAKKLTKKYEKESIFRGSSKMKEVEKFDK